MESKDKKAALALIRQIIDRYKMTFLPSPSISILFNKIDKVIEEFGLRDETDIMDSIYDHLMKCELYGEAAYFAKEYGL